MKRQNSTVKLQGHLYKFGQYAEQYFMYYTTPKLFILLTYSFPDPEVSMFCQA